MSTRDYDGPQADVLPPAQRRQRVFVLHEFSTLFPGVIFVLPRAFAAEAADIVNGDIAVQMLDVSRQRGNTVHLPLIGANLTEDQRGQTLVGTLAVLMERLGWSKVPEAVILQDEPVIRIFREEERLVLFLHDDLTASKTRSILPR